MPAEKEMLVELAKLNLLWTEGKKELQRHKERLKVERKKRVGLSNRVEITYRTEIRTLSESRRIDKNNLQRWASASRGFIQSS